MRVGPESAAAGTSIMPEAERIKEVLLARRESEEAALQAVRKQHADGTRAELGLPEHEPVDVSDLIDVRATKQLMVTPLQLATALPMTQKSADTTRQGRREVGDILTHKDDRVVVALGECSIHDPEASMEYSQLILGFMKRFPNIKILRRTFLEKPRTFKEKDADASWKGFLYDPRLDGSDDINLGAIASRMLLCRITDLGIPTIKEQLNALTPQVTDGLVVQDNIGARNAHDQKAMEFSSATSAISAHKNSLDGDIGIAAAAAATAHSSHSFLGVDYHGQLSMVRGMGNPFAHFILRGGSNGPNYSAEHVAHAKEIAAAHGLEISFAIDASHANSGKKAANQLIVVRDVSEQIASGEEAIREVHLETNLVGGAQKHKLGQSLDELVHGQSITDECAGPEQTEQMLSEIDEAAVKRTERKRRK